MNINYKNLENIKKELKKLNLPNKGLVAGQSLASLFYKELNLDIPCVINDIDIFVLRDEKKLNLRFRNNIKETDFFPTHTGSMNGTYFTLQEKRYYEIARSYYIGNNNEINIVEVKQTSHIKNKIDAEMLLSSFDFNCCAVGYDIESEFFYITENFIDFLKTKKLKIQSVHTPLHTLLRINKKLDDLKTITCDLKTERGILLSAIKYGNYCNYIVGEKFFKLYNKYKDTLIEDLFDFSDTNYEHKGYTYKQYVLDLTKYNKMIEDGYFYDLDKDKNQKNQFAVYSRYISANKFVHFYYIFFETNYFSQNYKDEFYKKLNSSQASSNDMLYDLFLMTLLNYKPSKNLNEMKLVDKKLQEILKNDPVFFYSLSSEYYSIEDIYNFSKRNRNKENKKDSSIFINSFIAFNGKYLDEIYSYWNATQTEDLFIKKILKLKDKSESRNINNILSIKNLKLFDYEIINIVDRFDYKKVLELEKEYKLSLYSLNDFLSKNNSSNKKSYNYLIVNKEKKEFYIYSVNNARPFIIAKHYSEEREESKKIEIIKKVLYLLSFNKKIGEKIINDIKNIKYNMLVNLDKNLYQGGKTIANEDNDMDFEDQFPF